MASWDILASPKNVGGLGFTNTRVMNQCLLAKWIFKIENNEDCIYCNLLRNKYLGEKVSLAVGVLTVLNTGEAF
jgi:hypothetical protein